MSLEKTTTFDFGEPSTIDSEEPSTIDSEEPSTIDSEEPSTFGCPTCGATAPSTSVPYDALGYAACPACGRSTRPGSDE